MATSKAKKLKKYILGFLRVELVNYFIFKLRFFYYTKLVRRFKVYSSENDVISNEYSKDMIKRGITSNRPLSFIRPLSVIKAVPDGASVLSIGCRFETELLFLVGYGFDADKVRGFDMISYSPWIDVGNMHEMPYQDGEWDVLSLGWVLPYSDNIPKAVSEIVRVTKNGGVVAVGLSAYPKEKQQEIAASGTFAVDPAKRMQTTEEWLGAFGDSVDKVYFRHDPPDDQEGHCSMVFSIKK